MRIGPTAATATPKATSSVATAYVLKATTVTPSPPSWLSPGRNMRM